MRSDGHLVAKAVDFDTSMFKNSLLSVLELRIKLTGGNCKRDSDCNYNPINCLGECDLATEVCTGRLKSSNLVVSNSLLYVLEIQVYKFVLHGCRLCAVICS